MHTKLRRAINASDICRELLEARGRDGEGGRRILHLAELIRRRFLNSDAHRAVEPILKRREIRSSACDAHRRRVPFAASEEDAPRRLRGDAREIEMTQEGLIVRLEAHYGA